MSASAQDRTGHRLLKFGVSLFLAGLLVGLAVPTFVNPRMGLASHLEGVMNGLFLMALGLLWPRLVLSARLLGTTFWLAVYGAFANLLATLLAAVWGAGRLMPIAAQGHVGTSAQENVVAALLVTLSIAMVAVCVLLLVGLKGDGSARQG